MKQPEEIIKGLEQDIVNMQNFIARANILSHGEQIKVAQEKIKFATNLITWIKS